MKNRNELIRGLSGLAFRSAWKRGVQAYALDLLNGIEDSDLEKITDRKSLEQLFLCGAGSWFRFSEGGCSLIGDEDIADRLCTSSERERVIRSGRLIEHQARALSQAFDLIWRNA